MRHCFCSRLLHVEAGYSPATWSKSSSSSGGGGGDGSSSSSSMVVVVVVKTVTVEELPVLCVVVKGDGVACGLNNASAG